MERTDFLGFIGGQSLAAIPALVGWTLAVVVAILLIRRGGGRPAILLLIGSGLMLGAALLRIPVAAVPPLLISRGWPMERAVGMASAMGLMVHLVQLGGIVCMVLAFWRQFKVSATLRQS